MAVPLGSLVSGKYYSIESITNADPEAMDLGDPHAPYKGKFTHSTETTAAFEDLTDKNGNPVTTQSEFPSTKYDFVESAGGRRRRRKSNRRSRSTRSRRNRKSRRRV